MFTSEDIYMMLYPIIFVCREGGRGGGAGGQHIVQQFKRHQFFLFVDCSS